MHQIVNGEKCFKPVKPGLVASNMIELTFGGGGGVGGGGGILTSHHRWETDVEVSAALEASITLDCLDVRINVNVSTLF